MEHNVYGTQATFWRDAYLTALRAGHPDPAAAADEAFLAFDCRFSEPTIDGAALCGSQMAQRIPQFGSNACSSLNTGAAGYAASVSRDYTADELVLQANKTETTVPSVVVSDPPIQNPSTEGLPAFEWKADDEVLG